MKSVSAFPLGVGYNLADLQGFQDGAAFVQQTKAQQLFLEQYFYPLAEWFQGKRVPGSDSLTTTSAVEFNEWMAGYGFDITAEPGGDCYVGAVFNALMKYMMPGTATVSNQFGDGRKFVLAHHHKAIAMPPQGSFPYTMYGSSLNGLTLQSSEGGLHNHLFIVDLGDDASAAKAMEDLVRLLIQVQQHIVWIQDNMGEVVTVQPEYQILLPTTYSWTDDNVFMNIFMGLQCGNGVVGQAIGKSLVLADEARFGVKAASVMVLEKSVLRMPILTPIRNPLFVYCVQQGYKKPIVVYMRYIGADGHIVVESAEEAAYRDAVTKLDQTGATSL